MCAQYVSSWSGWILYQQRNNTIESMIIVCLHIKAIHSNTKHGVQSFLTTFPTNKKAQVAFVRYYCWTSCNPPHGKGLWKYHEQYEKGRNKHKKRIKSNLIEWRGKNKNKSWQNAEFIFYDFCVESFSSVTGYCRFGRVVYLTIRSLWSGCCVKNLQWIVHLIFTWLEFVTWLVTSTNLLHAYNL